MSHHTKISSMNEVKTYLSFIALCVVLIGILSYLYSPDADKWPPHSVTIPLESMSVSEKANQEDEKLPKNTTETESKPIDKTTSDDTIYGKDETQKKRIHFTKILLGKKKDLEKLIDKKNRTTGDTSQIEKEIQETEVFIEMISDKIQNLQDF